MLNMPVMMTGENILLCGIGGGFDIYGTLPIYYTLTQNGLGNVCSLHSHQFVKLSPYVVDENGDYSGFSYMPEAHLAKFLKQRIYIDGRIGVVELRQRYQDLVSKLYIDRIIMVDGGVDSLMVGDEQHKGTIVEEYIAFAALKHVHTRYQKILVNIGFGCEAEEKISHYRVLENMAELIRGGAFIGSCSLTKDMQSFKFYRSAYEHMACVPNHIKSHIHPRIIPSIEGEFGETKGSNETTMKSCASVLLSPLMGVMWFFDADKVIRKNRIVTALEDHKTFAESVYTVNTLATRTRENKTIPY